MQDEKKIIEDCLASDYYRKSANEKAVKGLVQFYKMDEAVAHDIMSVKESYIMATFNTIKSQYGSIDAYLEKVMGLSKEKRELLQQKFLE